MDYSFRFITFREKFAELFADAYSKIAADHSRFIGVEGEGTSCCS